jgi:hypothetical protein
VIASTILLNANTASGTVFVTAYAFWPFVNNSAYVVVRSLSTAKAKVRVTTITRDRYRTTYIANAMFSTMDSQKGALVSWTRACVQATADGIQKGRKLLRFKVDQQLGCNLANFFLCHSLIALRIRTRHS